MDELNDVPYIDPDVQFIGVSKLRTLNKTSLQELQKTLVIQDAEEPLAILMPYDVYMKIQANISLVVALFDAKKSNFTRYPIEEVSSNPKA